MTGHICIIFTTTIFGVHIFEYYSSNSSTSKHTELTGVITSVCFQTNTCVCQSGHVSHRCQFTLTDSLDMCMCGVLCARCLNVTTLFNIDVKNTFSCRRDCQLLCCHSAPLSSFNTCSRYFSLHFLL